MGDGGCQERGDTPGRDTWGEAVEQRSLSRGCRARSGCALLAEPCSVQLSRHFLVLSQCLGTP